MRTGYSLAGAPWWPTRVLLDGRDITNVPTDFSAHPGGDLEVVFTQHPARFAGSVTDADGHPAAGAWVVVISADQILWQQWATTSNAQQAGRDGAFRLTALPGRYLVRAFPAATFTSRSDALKHVSEVARDAVAVELHDRETQVLTLAIR